MHHLEYFNYLSQEYEPINTALGFYLTLADTQKETFNLVVSPIDVSTGEMKFDPLTRATKFWPLLKQQVLDNQCLLMSAEENTKIAALLTAEQINKIFNFYPLQIQPHLFSICESLQCLFMPLRFEETDSVFEAVSQLEIRAKNESEEIKKNISQNIQLILPCLNSSELQIQQSSLQLILNLKYYINYDAIIDYDEGESLFHLMHSNDPLICQCAMQILFKMVKKGLLVLTEDETQPVFNLAISNDELTRRYATQILLESHLTAFMSQNIYLLLDKSKDFATQNAVLDLLHQLLSNEMNIGPILEENIMKPLLALLNREHNSFLISQIIKELFDINTLKKIDANQFYFKPLLLMLNSCYPINYHSLNSLDFICKTKFGRDNLARGFLARIDDLITYPKGLHIVMQLSKNKVIATALLKDTYLSSLFRDAISTGKTQRYALQILINLSKEAGFKNEVEKIRNGLKDLFSACETRSILAREYLSVILLNLARKETYHQMLLEAGCIPTLIKLAFQTNNKIENNVYHAICLLILKSEQHYMIFVHSQGYEFLFKNLNIRTTFLLIHYLEEFYSAPSNLRTHFLINTLNEAENNHLQQIAVKNWLTLASQETYSQVIEKAHQFLSLELPFKKLLAKGNAEISSSLTQALNLIKSPSLKQSWSPSFYSHSIDSDESKQPRKKIKHGMF